MDNKKIRVAIAHGDTNGIGYELILKAFEDPTMMELCTPIVYGSPKVAAYHAKALGIETQFTSINRAEEAKDNRLNVLNCLDGEVKVDLGHPSEESAKAGLKALNKALDDYQQGLFDTLVAIPMSNFDLPAYVQKALKEKTKPITLRCSEDLRVTLVTSHIALKEVPEAITKQVIVEKVKLLHNCLRRDLNISTPRIAVMALNPHANDEAEWGEEEQEMIIPAISELASQSIQAFGPYSADAFFGNSQYLRFDGVLAMYHDQGMVPFKSIVEEGSVDLVSGLPLVVTSPAQDATFEAAGKKQASPLSLLHAIYLAIDVTRNRQSYDEPLKNPLPKLYHEKRDDSEKVRFRSTERKGDDKKGGNSEETIA